MIEVKHLTKRYGKHTAVDDISFTVQDGCIYGLLGPNGAGKSTTMNMITGYLAPTGGTVAIDGHDVQEEPKEAKACIGYLPEIPPLYTDMTVQEYLLFVSELKGKKKKADRVQDVAQAVQRAGLQEMEKRLIRNLSKGYRQLSAVTDYPLHVGVTEAGTYQMGLLKSGMGIGGMLLEGIGDTIRVSLAAEPEKEVEAGYNILRAVGFPVAGPEVITCPTCGRTQYPCTEIANEVEKRLQGYKKSIKVAVMGCVVNGPGEAREADIGIAGGKGEAVLFIHGQPIKKLTGDNILDQFMDEIYKI